VYSPVTVPSLSGVAAIDCIAALEELVGPSAIAAAKSQLAEEMRFELDSMSAVSWVPLETFNEFVDAIGRAAGVEPDPLLDKSIRLATQRTFRTVWRMLLRVTTDDALIKRAPLIYSRSRNFGQLTARMAEPGRAEVLLTGAADANDRTLRTVGVGIQCVAEIAGRRDVRMSFARTSDGGRYDIRWRT
jgi:hypothetical protein